MTPANCGSQFQTSRSYKRINFRDGSNALHVLKHLWLGSGFCSWTLNKTVSKELFAMSATTVITVLQIVSFLCPNKELYSKMTSYSHRRKSHWSRIRLKNAFVHSLGLERTWWGVWNKSSSSAPNDRGRNYWDSIYGHIAERHPQSFLKGDLDVCDWWILAWVSMNQEKESRQNLTQLNKFRSQIAPLPSATASQVIRML